MVRKFYSALFLMVAASTASYGSTIVFQDNFDSYSPATFGNLSTLGTNWTVNGSVDVLGPSYYSYLVVGDESTNAVDLDGSSQGGLTSTALALAAGTYTLTFDLNGSHRGGATDTIVSVGTFLNANIPQTSSVLGTGLTYTFTVGSASSTSIVFASNTPGTVGSILDNVVLTYNGAIPEPSTMLLMLAAVPLLWIARKRHARG